MNQGLEVFGIVKSLFKNNCPIDRHGFKVILAEISK
jgi:hypothetical protein